MDDRGTSTIVLRGQSILYFIDGCHLPFPTVRWHLGFSCHCSCYKIESRFHKRQLIYIFVSQPSSSACSSRQIHTISGVCMTNGGHTLFNWFFCTCSSSQGVSLAASIQQTLVFTAFSFSGGFLTILNKFQRNLSNPTSRSCHARRRNPPLVALSFGGLQRRPTE